MRLSVITLLVLAGCPENRVTPFNANPEATITSHEEGDVVAPGLIELRGNVSDPDDTAENLLALWVVDGTTACVAEAPTSQGTSLCSAFVSEPVANIVLEVRDPYGAAGNHTIDLEVGDVPNDDPTILILSLIHI